MHANNKTDINLQFVLPFYCSYTTMGCYRSRDKRGCMYWCFVDVEKEFSSMNRDTLWYKIQKKDVWEILWTYKKNVWWSTVLSSLDLWGSDWKLKRHKDRGKSFEQQMVTHAWINSAQELFG
jgi:hypothetical protein